MSLQLCIPDLIEQKRLTGQRATRAAAIYQQLLNRYDHQMGDDAAKARATAETIKRLTHETDLKKRRAGLQASRQLAILDASANKFTDGQLPDAPISGKALLAHLIRDERAKGISNVEYRWRAIKGQALGKIYDILARHRANMLGEVRNKSDLADMVRAASGEAVDNVNARELADAWSQTAEWLRLRANAAGADIGKLEGWAVPHHHHEVSIGSVAPEVWIDDVLPALDLNRMMDYDTGQPMTEGRAREMLAEVYETIISDGWNKRAAGGIGEGSMAGRNDHARILHFRDADAWLAYQDKYGSGTIYDTMMSHIENMSRDIAAMEILGPNPAATVRWMQDMVEKESATKGDMESRGIASIDHYAIGKVWDEITGANRRQVRRGLALTGSTLRNLQTSTKLGSAVIASMSDHATAMQTRWYNGLPVASHITGYLKALNPLDRRDADFIRRMGVISDEFTGRMAASGRLHSEDDMGGRLAMQKGRKGEAINELSRRLADGVLRGSGLSAHTIAAREAMGMEFLSAVRTYTEHGWDNLPPPWRGFLERNGMAEADWNALRTSAPLTHKGADFLNLDALPQGLRDKFQEGMLQEIDFAVPTGGIHTRAMVNVAQPGTIAGELIRTGFQFKMFPVTVVAMHGGRAWHLPAKHKKIGYAAAFLGSTMAAGALSVQMAEMSKGKNPKPMADPDFIWKAMLKGGGLGIMGDLVDLGQTEFGQDFGDIIKGPSWGTAQSLNTVRQAAWAELTLDRDDPDMVEKAAKLRGRAMRELLMREVPGSNIWYLRAAYERAVVDQLTSWTSAGAYDDNFTKMERRAEKEGQSYWLPPGQGLAGAQAPSFEGVFDTPGE